MKQIRCYFRSKQAPFVFEVNSSVDYGDNILNLNTPAMLNHFLTKILDSEITDENELIRLLTEVNKERKTIGHVIINDDMSAFGVMTYLKVLTKLLQTNRAGVLRILDAKNDLEVTVREALSQAKLTLSPGELSIYQKIVWLVSDYVVEREDVPQKPDSQEPSMSPSVSAEPINNQSDSSDENLAISSPISVPATSPAEPKLDDVTNHQDKEKEEIPTTQVSFGKKPIIFPERISTKLELDLTIKEDLTEFLKSRSVMDGRHQSSTLELLDTVDKNGNTPGHLAVSMSGSAASAYFAFLEKMISRNAEWVSENLTKQNRLGETIGHIALIYRRAEIVVTYLGVLRLLKNNISSILRPKTMEGSTIGDLVATERMHKDILTGYCELLFDDNESFLTTITSDSERTFGHSILSRKKPSRAGALKDLQRENIAHCVDGKAEFFVKFLIEKAENSDKVKNIGAFLNAQDSEGYTFGHRLIVNYPSLFSLYLTLIKKVFPNEDILPHLNLQTQEGMHLGQLILNKVSGHDNVLKDYLQFLGNLGPWFVVNDLLSKQDPLLLMILNKADDSEPKKLFLEWLDMIGYQDPALVKAVLKPVIESKQASSAVIDLNEKIHKVSSLVEMLLYFEKRLNGYKDNTVSQDEYENFMERWDYAKPLVEGGDMGELPRGNFQHRFATIVEGLTQDDVQELVKHMSEWKKSYDGIKTRVESLKVGKTLASKVAENIGETSSKVVGSIGEASSKVVGGIGDAGSKVFGGLGEAGSKVVGRLETTFAWRKAKEEGSDQEKHKKLRKVEVSEDERKEAGKELEKFLEKSCSL
jgi:hypothetical protein